ncbi:hypothetical protein LOK49_LG08G00928 [Camellia lanceoleosa]|uniref:Uncharacterized protein n=1 Tax=Camellia lanceoleosa TaxID=1840588 RepID=A0ACC0GRB4_9ERIC|nr:hypothetical protein LOK49_LG08G00928 [Camellia lanceoleosa]
MSFEEEEESFEHTLLVVREVAHKSSHHRRLQVRRVAPSDKIWSGRLAVSARTSARSAKILLRSFARFLLAASVTPPSSPCSIHRGTSCSRSRTEGESTGIQ